MQQGKFRKFNNMKHKPKAITEKAPQTTTNYKTGFEILYAYILHKQDLRYYMHALYGDMEMLYKVLITQISVKVSCRELIALMLKTNLTKNT